MKSLGTVGVVGNGVVGHATARSFEEWAEVRVYDREPAKSTHPLVFPGPDRAVLDCSIIFVCLPEGQVTQFFSDLFARDDVYPDRARDLNFVLKSTLPIGATRALAERYGMSSVVHCPEFLTARCAVSNAMNPTRFVVGIPSSGKTRGIANRCVSRLNTLLQRRFPHVPQTYMTSEMSELLKLATNGFFAVKVAYWNEVRDLWEKYDETTETDDPKWTSQRRWEMWLSTLLQDGRVDQSHTQVPGHDGRRGFGGACLPKDLEQLVAEMMKSGCEWDGVAQAASDRNLTDRSK